MTLSSQPLSPLDGRYLAQVRELGEHLSEAGLNRARVQVEVEWLIWLVEKDLLQVNKTLSEKEAAKLRELVSEFSDESVEKLGKIEATTRHDVKAVEYFVRDALTAMKREDLHELARPRVEVQRRPAVPDHRHARCVPEHRRPARSPP